MNPAMLAALAPAATTVVGNMAVNSMSDSKNPTKGGPEGTGFMKGDGAKATLGTALAGGVAGAALKTRDLGPDAGPREKIMAAVTGGLAGTGSGLLANMQHDAIHAKGGAVKAALFGAGSNMLASTLEKDGPSMIQSALAGASTGYVADSFHDKLTKKGYGMQADLLSDSVQGATLGYTGMGDGKGAMLGGALGAAGGFATQKMTQNEYKGVDELAGSSRADEMVAAQAMAGAGAGVGFSGFGSDKDAGKAEPSNVAEKLSAMYDNERAAQTDAAQKDRDASDDAAFSL